MEVIAAARGTPIAFGIDTSALAAPYILASGLGIPGGDEKQFSKSLDSRGGFLYTDACPCIGAIRRSGPSIVTRRGTT